MLCPGFGVRNLICEVSVDMLIAVARANLSGGGRFESILGGGLFFVHSCEVVFFTGFRLAVAVSI